MLGLEEKVTAVMRFGFLTILFTELLVHACNMLETQKDNSLFTTPVYAKLPCNIYQSLQYNMPSQIMHIALKAVLLKIHECTR